MISALVTHRLAGENYAGLEAPASIMPSSIFRLITHRSSIQKIIVNIGWLFADNVAALLAGFLVGAWVARYLGPTQYGQYNYALAIVALFTPLVALGLRDIVVRDIVREPEGKDEILGTTFGLLLFGALLALGLSIGVAQATRSENPLAQWFIIILAGQFIFQVLSVTLGYWFNSQVQAKYVVWANNIALLLYSLVRIGLVLAKSPLIAFAWAALGQAFVYAVATVVFHRLSGQTLFTWRISLARAQRLLENSWPLLVTSLAVMIYSRIGQVMLGNMVAEKELGLYSAAIRLSEFGYFIPTAIAASVFPALIRSHENDSDELHRRRMQLFYDVMTGIAYTIVLPIALLAPLLVRILFGPEYYGAGAILRIHVWALMIGSVGVARGRWIIAADMVSFYMIATILGALSNIALNFLLIPKYGGLGAAWAVVISNAVSSYLSSLLSRPLWPVFRQQSLALLVPFRIFSLKRAVDEILKSPASSLHGGA